MKILALNPYHGGSHAQFLNQWQAHSRHEFTVLTLPPRHFKWRIRQAAVGFAHQARELGTRANAFDVIWTTSLLDAAELRGLLPPSLRTTPLVVYFHENQYEYPVRKSDERDVHFGLINWVSALCADEVWFNSQFNRRTFFEGAARLLRKMPDEKELQTLSEIENKSWVVAPGAELDTAFSPKPTGPLSIVWVSRWEHDKRPDLFFAALRRLKDWRLAFRVSLLGQGFRSWPSEFHDAREEFEQELIAFGYQESRAAYWSVLRSSDVVVSTADHEFFGLAVLEAVSTGCIPVVPARLVYEELYSPGCLYRGSPDSLAERLQTLSQMKHMGRLDSLREELGLSELVHRLGISRRAKELDDALERAASR